jgi:hypothetical protein
VATAKKTTVSAPAGVPAAKAPVAKPEATVDETPAAPAEDKSIEDEAFLKELEEMEG